ncbi:MAG: helix-turn-helix domain-containing protein [Dehalococcoidia bacterium]
MPGHTRWSDIRARIFETPEGREAYAERRRALALGMQTRHLRELQDLSQAELARRAGMIQSAIARIDAGEADPKLSFPRW